MLQLLEQLCRFRSNIREDIDYCSERRPGCRRARTDHQRLDSDAEESHRSFAVFQAELGEISWRVWIGDRGQLLAGTRQGLPSHADGQCQTQSWGIENKICTECFKTNAHFCFLLGRYAHFTKSSWVSLNSDFSCRKIIEMRNKYSLVSVTEFRCRVDCRSFLQLNSGICRWK